MAFLKTRVGTFYDKEILKYPTGLEATRNIVIDSTLVPVDASSGRYVLQAGQLMVTAAGVAGTSEIDQLTVTATGGSFDVFVPANEFQAGGGETVTIPLAGITAQKIQDALTALPNVSADGVVVTGPASNVYTLTWGGRMAKTPIVLTVDASAATGGTASIARGTPGVSATASAVGAKVGPAAASGVSTASMVGILTHTVEFFYPVEANVTDEPAAVYFHQCIFDTTKLLAVSGNLANTQAAFPTCLFQ